MNGNDHDDKLPPDLQTLIDLGYMNAKALESRLREKEASGPDYIYISGQNLTHSPTNIIAYDNPEGLKDQNGVNALFLDCHVSFINLDSLDQELTKTYKALGRERPESRDSSHGHSIK